MFPRGQSANLSQRPSAQAWNRRVSGYIGFKGFGASSFGAGFGGNGTIIGSTANIIVVTLSEKTRKPITAVFWMKRGLPVMVLACAIASVLYILFFSIF